MNKKLTDLEIVKALECCAEQKCWECPNEPKENKKGTFGCSWEMMLATLNLINRLEAENKKLEEAVGKEFTCFVGDPHKVEHCPYLEELETAKAEAYKEFAEKLNAEAEKVEIDREGDFVEAENKIYDTVAIWCKATSDNLLKELVGEQVE